MWSFTAKVYSGVIDYMTNIATMPICDKTLSKSFSQDPKGFCHANLVCSINDWGPTKFVQTSKI